MGAKRASGAVLAGRVAGRQRELAALTGAWAAARDGRGGVVVLAGEAGIGKTRLARAAGEAAVGDQALVLCGRAVSGPVRAEFRPLAEALCSAVRTAGLPETTELAPFRPLLGRLIPEWAPVAYRAAEVSVVALGEAVLRFLRAVAGERGCLLVLEDLHWADPETLAVFEYLADNLAAERVLCVVTLRDDEGGAGLEAARRLAVRRACKLVTLARLGPAEVAEMAADCLGVEVVPDPVLALAGRAGGVPLLVEAMLLAAVAEAALRQEDGSWRLACPGHAVVPVSFADSVRLRLAALGAPGRGVVRAAAVLGAFDSDLLADTAGTEEAAVAAALAAAAGCGIVVVDGDPPALRFRHALTADAVAATLFPPERTELSRRALAAVTARRAGLPGRWCEIAAELARQAGDVARAAGLLREIGRRARDAGALASAAAALERARELAAADDDALAAIEEDLVEVFALAGDHARAAQAAATLLGRLVARPEVAVRRAVTRLRLARAAAAATCWGQARAHVEAARAEVPDADGALACRLDALDAVIAAGEDDPSRACQLAERALAAAEHQGLPEVACEALEVLGRCRRPGDLSAAEAAFSRGHDMAVRHGLGVWRVRASHELGIVDLLRSASVQRLIQARDLAAELGAPAMQSAIELHVCAGLWLRGEDPASREAALRAAGLARRYGVGHVLAAALAFLALVHARAGDGTAMEGALAEAAGHAGGDASFPATAACARAVLALAADDRAAAVRHLDPPQVRDSGQIRSQDPAIGWWALLRCVDPGGAEAALADARRGGEPVNVITRGFLRYADAVVLGRAGRAAHAAAAVAAGDELLGELPWLRYLGLRWVSEAAVADGWGRPEAWLGEAEAFFFESGQPRLAAACRSLLRRAGAPLRRRRDGDETVPAALRGRGVTFREYEVMTLLAEGLPDADIAKRLYLSPRTVERHIANVCVKVGAGRRAQLVAYAARTARS